MALVLNPTGLAQAIKLTEQAQFRLNTIWDRNRPTDDAAEKFIALHGIDAYAAWHLAIDPTAPAESKTRYQLPYGDFKSVHYSGVRSIKQIAERDGQGELSSAAESILDLLDRFNAC
jgi:hypothetical protein